MVGVECLDLNTSVGGSLSENGYGKCRFVLVAVLVALSGSSVGNMP